MRGANSRIVRHPDDDIFNAFQAGFHKAQADMYLAQARHYHFLAKPVRDMCVKNARAHWHDYLRWAKRLPARAVPPPMDLTPILKASIIDLAERRAAKELTP